ncbi:hypothetical protein [Streptomyces iranensis]|uniref:Glycoside hydrolase family 3 domain protein n=1 Tax=Streptomyces iranensis TaxID=576784 RepID=A0ABS4N9D2_9ACTN|nr:hypothetical protein [Streptomyces iranensis]MBP2068600.1 hypothetical protein [Streptomyces iranensis]
MNFPGEQGHVRYDEGVMVGYRWYGTTRPPVRYPFGHGLSYTTFAVRDLSVRATGDDSARASVTVALTITNTGARGGWHRTTGATNIARANRRSHDLITTVTSSYPTTQ